MSGAMILGLGFGLSAIGFLVALRPRRQRLIAELEAIDSDISDRSSWHRSSNSSDLRARLHVQLESGASELVGRFPRVGETIRRDLTVCDRRLGSLAEQCVLAALAGGFLPFGTWALSALGGARVPLFLPAWVGLLGATIGACFPVLVLSSEAQRHRRHARKVVGCFLDLVVLSLAGGLGIEGALMASASICETEVSRRLSRGLKEARDAGRTPWESLAALGGELGVPELVELAAAVSLAGTEGARIRQTLASKASSIRSHELADAESEANTITERLFLPGVLLLLGFLVFIGYPAVARFTAGF